jgi:hypothetical protein
MVAQLVNHDHDSEDEGHGGNCNEEIQHFTKKYLISSGVMPTLNDSAGRLLKMF